MPSAIEKTRDKTIDALKGIGILFMVLGHVYLTDEFDKYIHSFHMPLFFIVSGYLLKFLCFIGKNSIVYLCLNQLIIYLSNIGMSMLSVRINLLTKILMFVISIFILSFIALLKLKIIKQLKSI